MYADSHSGSHRCPSVVSAACSPCYPCRSPLISGNPSPSVVIIVKPSAVVERCPTPRKVRYPGVSVVGHHPISVSSIGMEIAPHSRNPDISVTIVSNPSTMRTKNIVENLNVYSTAVIVVIIISVIIVIIVVITVIPVVNALRISSALKSHARSKQCCYESN